MKVLALVRYDYGVSADTVSMKRIHNPRKCDSLWSCVRSGGKDSCYNALLCQQYGHDIVALGNLYPFDSQTEELDSYMYQTVGHTLIAAYSECTGLPLFRKRILGTSAEKGLVYEEKHMCDDEVEDLAVLLKYAQSVMPDIEAVSSGAIASDYQRNRVERICSRLGLVSLAYMWHQPQSTLLRRMIRSGIDARLIKVAAAGLDPRKHLGKSIAEMCPYLHKLRDLYGSNICGEGGEYETLTLDCPLFVHGRIIIDQSEIEIASDDSLAPVAWLKPIKFHVEPKDAEICTKSTIIQVPDSFPSTPNYSVGISSEETFRSSDKGCDQSIWRVFTRGHVHAGYVTFHGYCRLVTDRSFESGRDLGIDDVTKAFECLLTTLKHTMEASAGTTFASGLFCLLFVHDMEHFAHLNKVYSNYFPHINPPSRATLEIGRNSDIFIAIQVTCARPHDHGHELKERRVLHVQSISDWAPCCIGPYSQATSYDGLVRFAGQIALDPATCSLAKAMSIHDQVKRVSKTCDLVGAAMKIDFKQTMLWSDVFISDTIENINDVHELVLEILDPTCFESSSDDDQEYTEEYLMAMSKPLRLVTLPMKAMTMVIQCPRLPRDAKIEIQSVNIDIDVLKYTPESDSDDDQESVQHDWLSSLQYRQLPPAPFSQHCHCLLSKGRLMKLHITVSQDSHLQDISESIKSTISSCLEDSDLSGTDIVGINAYVNTSLYSTQQRYDEVERAIDYGFQDVYHDSIFTVPVSGVWNALEFEKGSESMAIGIQVLWQKHPL